MPIRNVRNDVRETLEALPERVRKALVYNLSHVGERVVNAARTSANFTDRTGNLRGSIGYVIAEDGRIVGESDFKPVKGGGDGPRAGRELAEQLARQTRGLTLIVVAGMDYASHVANRGYDVLDTAERLAARLAPEMLRKLGLE